MTSAPIGMAIIGCGRIAEAHAGAIQQQPDVAKLVALVDVDMSRAKPLAERYGALVALGSVESVLARSDVEAVVLCLPIDLHAQSTVQCLDAGRHVLVEKPMAANGRAAKQMLDAAVRSGKTLVTAQSRRHSSGVRYIQDNFHRYGRLRSVEASFCTYWDGPQAPWWADRPPEKGLVIPQLGSHMLDLVQLFIGERPERLFSQTNRWRDCWIAEDEVTMLLRYPSGRMANVHLSYNQRPFFERLVLLFDHYLVELRDATTVFVNGEIVHRPPAEDKEGELLTNELFKNQIREFVFATRGQKNRSAMAPEGVDQIRLLDAALESSLTNKVIAFDW
jgi:predicted dehydrogenase